MGTPASVKLGPGLLYIAAIGTTEPTTLTGALPSAWVAVGYTEEGSEFGIEVTSEDIEVAEELDPIRTVNTKRSVSVTFDAAEITATNLKRAFNGGTISAPTGGYVTFDPPAAADTPVRAMIVWQADDNQERWLFRQCFQAGPITMARKKAPDKTLIPMSFKCEKPTGFQPFRAWFADTLA